MTVTRAHGHPPGRCTSCQPPAPRMPLTECGEPQRCAQGLEYRKCLYRAGARRARQGTALAPVSAGSRESLAGNGAESRPLLDNYNGLILVQCPPSALQQPVISVHHITVAEPILKGFRCLLHLPLLCAQLVVPQSEPLEKELLESRPTDADGPPRNRRPDPTTRCAAGAQPGTFFRRHASPCDAAAGPAAGPASAGAGPLKWRGYARVEWHRGSDTACQK